MAHLEPKYTLFDSSGHMLAPKTLSGLLSKPITHVDIQPMEHEGATGAQLSRVHTDAGCFVLKQMSMETDFAMFATNDPHCRSITLWQYGLLDQLLPRLEHKIIACACQGDTWTILMEDLGDSVFSEERNNMPRNLILPSLDNLAKMHAMFWNKAYLQDPRLGLHSSKEFLISAGRFLPQNKANKAMGAFSGWFEAFRGGWEVAEDLLSTEVFAQLHSLVEAPEPFLKAIARYPFTLTHGDYKKENMAYTDRFILFDWQLAACSLMTYDLAHYVIIGNAQDALGEVDAVRYYRERLEIHLKQRFDDVEWQAMHDLGFALFAFWGILLFAMFYKGDENPDKRAHYKMIVQKQGQMIMDALRWL